MITVKITPMGGYICGDGELPKDVSADELFTKLLKAFGTGSFTDEQVAEVLGDAKTTRVKSMDKAVSAVQHLMGAMNQQEREYYDTDEPCQITFLNPALHR